MWPSDKRNRHRIQNGFCYDFGSRRVNITKFLLKSYPVALQKNNPGCLCLTVKKNTAQHFNRTLSPQKFTLNFEQTVYKFLLMNFLLLQSKLFTIFFFSIFVCLRARAGVSGVISIGRALERRRNRGAREERVKKENAFKTSNNLLKNNKIKNQLGLFTFANVNECVEELKRCTN